MLLLLNKNKHSKDKKKHNLLVVTVLTYVALYERHIIEEDSAILLSLDEASWIVGILENEKSSEYTYTAYLLYMIEGMEMVCERNLTPSMDRSTLQK